MFHSYLIIIMYEEYLTVNATASVHSWWEKESVETV